MKTYLSLGAGVDTTAILLMPDILKEMDFVLFADTGGEHPETYQYMERYIMPYLEENGKPLIIVQGEENIGGSPVRVMEEAYLKWKMIPTRPIRHCTDKWKIKPMHKYLAEMYPNEDLRVIIGFAYDERHRMNTTKWKDQTPWYPLIEKELTRDDCMKIISNHGWEIPPKSGCFYCPFQRLDQWKDMRFRHPDLWQRAVALEENGSRFPEMTLSNFSKKANPAYKPRRLRFINAFRKEKKKVPERIPLTLREVDMKLGRNLYEFEEYDADGECSWACMT